MFTVRQYLLFFSSHHDSTFHSLLNLSHSIFTCISSVSTGQPLIGALDLVDRLSALSVQIITRASEGRIGQPEEGFVFFSKWSMLADEMVSLHRARAHWGLWGVRHIWANRLLMSCLHEPLIMASERDISTRGSEVAICCGSALFGLAQGLKSSLFAETLYIFYINVVQIHRGQTLYSNKGSMKMPAACYCNLHVLWIN